MAALFDSMDWVNEENDLSTVIGSGTRIASEIARDDSGNTPSYQSGQLMERDTWKSINQLTDVQIQRYPQSGNTGSNCAQWTRLTSINTDCVACVLRNSNHEDY